MSAVLCLCRQNARGPVSLDSGAIFTHPKRRVLSWMRQESTQLKGQKFQGCPLGSVGNGRNSVTICGGEGKSGGAKSTDDESWSGQSSSAATSQQPRDEASSLSIATADVVQEMKKLLENEPQIAAQAAGVLVTSISRQGRAALLAALYSSGTCTRLRWIHP